MFNRVFCRCTVQDICDRTGRERQRLCENRFGPFGNEGHGPRPVSAVGQDPPRRTAVPAVRSRKTVFDQTELPARRAQRRGRVRPGPLQQRARPVGQVPFHSEVRCADEDKSSQTLLT